MKKQLLNTNPLIEKSHESNFTSSENIVIGCLKLISRGKCVTISGTETLASDEDVFDSIDPKFKNLCRDLVDERPAKVVDAEVYEQIEDADYPNIFGSFGQNLDRLCFTNAQVKSFEVNHAKDYMRVAEEWTFFRFLFKVGNEFFIEDVRVHSDGKSRDVRITPFLPGNVRHAIHRHRIVVPQLTISGAPADFELIPNSKML